MELNVFVNLYAVWIGPWLDLRERHTHNFFCVIKPDFLQFFYIASKYNLKQKKKNRFSLHIQYFRSDAVGIKWMNTIFFAYETN